jgi:basic membrane protein A
VSGNWKPGVVKAIGLENPEAVSLTLGDNVPYEVKRQVEDLREKIVNDKIEV